MDVGLKCLKEGSADCAVIFVHGILPSRASSWKHANGTYWPDLLAAADIGGILSIYVYSYQSDLFSADYDLDDVVADLKQRLRDAGIPAVPRIVFVCHSMGGIVVRRYLVREQLNKEDFERATLYGLFLVASPSLGSEYADWLNPIATFFHHSQADSLRFVTGNRWLDSLDRDFHDLKELGKIDIRGRELIEDKFIVLKKWLFFPQVVQRIAGARYFGEPLKVSGSDHFSIAKPASDKDIQHTALIEFVAGIVPGFAGGSLAGAQRHAGKATPERKFVVAVARLERDTDRQEFKKVLGAIQDFFGGAEAYDAGRSIVLGTGNQNEALKAGHEQARRMLTGMPAHALVWGELLSSGVNRQLRLHWTLAQEAIGAKSTERYDLGSEFDLPPLFWEDLSNTLGAIVTASAVQILGDEGHYVADKLRGFLQKTQAILDSNKDRWDQTAWSQVTFAHADALSIYGDQTGDNDALSQAVTAYREVLKGRTREKAPLDWAMTQDNLGNTLRSLGERESGTVRLEEAVLAHQEALKERTRDRVPLAWAITQNNLGNALRSLGEREQSIERIETALERIRAALALAQNAGARNYDEEFRATLERALQALDNIRVASMTNKGSP